MNKIERELESFRKTFGEVPARIKDHDEDIQNIMKMTLEEKENSKFELEKIISRLDSSESEVKKIGSIDVLSQNLKL